MRPKKRNHTVTIAAVAGLATVALLVAGLATAEKPAGKPASKKSVTTDDQTKAAIMAKLNEDLEGTDLKPEVVRWLAEPQTFVKDIVFCTSLRAIRPQVFKVEAGTTTAALKYRVRTPAGWNVQIARFFIQDGKVTKPPGLNETWYTLSAHGHPQVEVDFEQTLPFQKWTDALDQEKRETDAYNRKQAGS